MEDLEGLHILRGEEVIQGSDVLANFNEQTAVTTAHLPQEHCRS